MNTTSNPQLKPLNAKPKLHPLPNPDRRTLDAKLPPPPLPTPNYPSILSQPETRNSTHETGASSARLVLRPYQIDAFRNRAHGVEVWLWGRQTGKSFTLAAWAVDRLLNAPGRLVTILSNSKSNGMELNLKCAEVCRRFAVAFEQEDLSVDSRFEMMNYETRVTLQGKTGRIKVLPANPRTARGFSGDLILDEFAFHENSTAIWEAAEPILAANPDYLCRVASTPNGRHNMFYRLATNPQIPLRKVSRSDAYAEGLQIFHPVTREPITPEQARELALDKRAYDQNYECLFETENMALLTYELILAAERENIGLISHQSWSPETLPFLVGMPSTAFRTSLPIRNQESEIRNCPSQIPNLESTAFNRKSKIVNRELYLGADVGRNRDITVITVLEKSGQSLAVRAILRMHDTRLPDQQEQLAAICRLPGFRRACIDMTGLGLGLFEYTQKQFGSRISGVNFASHLPLQPHSPLSIRNEKSGIRNGATAAAPEVLALGLLAAFEDRRIQHPIDEQLREDLRKPERVVTPSGRVSIAASRDGAGHADHFWSLALAVHAAQAEPEIYIHVVPRRKPFHRIDRQRLM